MQPSRQNLTLIIDPVSAGTVAILGKKPAFLLKDLPMSLIHQNTLWHI